MIRRARPEDAEAVASVFIPSFAGMTYLPRLHTEEETRAWIRQVVMAGCEVWIEERQEQVVGMAALSEGRLEHLYVHPAAQGQGIGTALLEVAKERRPNGFRLWVFQKNEGARRFYERHGCRLLELTDGSGNEEKEPDALYEWTPTPPRAPAA